MQLTSRKIGVRPTERISWQKVMKVFLPIDGQMTARWATAWPTVRCNCHFTIQLAIQQMLSYRRHRQVWYELTNYHWQEVIKLPTSNGLKRKNRIEQRHQVDVVAVKTLLSNASCVVLIDHRSRCILNVVTSFEPRLKKRKIFVEKMKHFSSFVFLVVLCLIGLLGMARSEETGRLPCICTRNFDPVCGSNDHTYSNPCMLDCEAKSSKGRSLGLRMVSKGPCDKDRKWAKRII